MENNEGNNKKKKTIAIISSIIGVVAIAIILLCVSKCSSGTNKKNNTDADSGATVVESKNENGLDESSLNDNFSNEDDSSKDDIFSGDDVLVLEKEEDLEQESDNGFIKDDSDDSKNLALEDKKEDVKLEKEEKKSQPSKTETSKPKPTSTKPNSYSQKKPTQPKYETPRDPQCNELERLFKEFKATDDDNEKNRIVNEALDISREVISKGLESREAHFFLSQDYTARGNDSAAINELNTAIKIGPDYLFYYYLGKLLYRQGKFEGAIKAFKKSCELNMQFAPSRYNLGLSYVKVNKIDQALSSYKQAINIKPNYEQAYLGIGRLYKQVKFYDDALVAYKKVIEINNTNVSARMDMGVIYNEEGKYPEAIAIYREALPFSEFGELQTILKYNLSIALYNNGDYSQALTAARESYEEKFFITDKIEEANITYNYGLILETCEQYEAAVEIYKEALAINRSHLKAKINLSALYMKSDKPNADEVLRLLNEAYVVAPFNFEVNNNMGNAYVLKEDYKNAVIYLNNALQSHPDDKVVKQNLASSFLKAEDYEMAEKVYLEIVEDEPKNYQALLDLSKVYIQLGKDETAMVYLVKLQKSAPDFKKEEVNGLLANLKI